MKKLLSMLLSGFLMGHAYSAQQTLTNSAGMLTKANENFTEVYNRTPYKTPYEFDAGGAADDTARLASCFASGRCLIPASFNASASLTIPDGGSVVCTGQDSGIVFTNPTGPGIQIGSMVFGGNSTTNPYTTGQSLRGCKITGTATVGVLVKHATRVDIFNVRSSTLGAWGFDLADTFGSSFTKLSTHEAPGMGGFTGGCFRFRDGFNANYASNLYTSNTNEPYAFYIGASGEADSPSVLVGNVIDVPTAQGTLVGIYLGKGISGLTINGYYSEQVKSAFVSGTLDAAERPHGVVWNGGYFSGIRDAVFGGSYLGEVVIDLNQVVGMTFNSPIIQVYPHHLNAPITVTGDGSNGQVYGLIKPDGTFNNSLIISNPGEGYTTCGLAMPGGASGTCIASGGKIISVSISVNATGLVRTTPVAVRYFSVRGVTFNDPQLYLGGALWPYVVRASGATNRGGITIHNDVSITQPAALSASTGNAEVIKADDNTSQHFVIRRDNNGAEQLQGFIPPIYP